MRLPVLPEKELLRVSEVQSQQSKIFLTGGNA